MCLWRGRDYGYRGKKSLHIRGLPILIRKWINPPNLWTRIRNLKGYGQRIQIVNLFEFVRLFCNMLNDTAVGTPSTFFRLNLFMVEKVNKHEPKQRIILYLLY